MCENCNVCTLISNDCLSILTPLKGFDLVDLSDMVQLANIQLEELTVCDLCEGRDKEDYQFTEVIENEKFKAYYANLIYANWLVVYGDGKASPEGHLSKKSDDYSEFTIKTASEISKKTSGFKEQVLFPLEKAFMKYFKKAFPSCNECIEVLTTCGKCKSDDCTCHDNEYNSDYDTI